MKDYIIQHRNEINNFVHPTYPVKYKRDGSLCLGLAKAMEYTPAFAALLDSIDDSLSRHQVAEYYREDIYKGFVATLLWGGFHKDRNTIRRFVAVTTMDRGEITRKLERVREMLSRGEVQQATESMLDGENEIVGLKLSYVSKILYFLAYDMNITPKPLIYDQFLAHAHCALLDCMSDLFPYYYNPEGKLVYGDLYELSGIYCNYLETMRQTAADCGIERVDDLEAWLFGWPLKRRAAGDNPRRTVMQKSRENAALQEVVMLARDCFNEEEADIAALVRIVRENHIDIDTFAYDEDNPGCNKEHPFVIGETENYVHLEYSLTDLLFCNRIVEKKLIRQQLLDEDGHKVDCLTFMVWPASENEPPCSTRDNTERYYFDITAGYSANNKNL